jgi:hypothetical protein
MSKAATPATQAAAPDVPRQSGAASAGASKSGLRRPSLPMSEPLKPAQRPSSSAAPTHSTAGRAPGDVGGARAAVAHRGDDRGPVPQPGFIVPR